MGYTVQDEVEEFIVSMLDQGYTKAEIIEEIPEVFDGFDIGLASDAYEDYENDNDPKNEEATVGDIERFIDELEVEGFPRDHAIARATKRFKLSAQEIRSMIESTANQEVLQYLDNLTETLNKVVEGWDEANETESVVDRVSREYDFDRDYLQELADMIDPEDLSEETLKAALEKDREFQIGVDEDDLNSPMFMDDESVENEQSWMTLARKMYELVHDEGWDESEAAQYIIETEMGFNPDESDDAAYIDDQYNTEDGLIDILLDNYYELKMSRR